MCRILAVRSENKMNMKFYLEQFSEIARTSEEYQGHGWGYSFLKDGEWYTEKSIKPIWEDEIPEILYTTCLVAHARSAFMNEGIRVENNMPFGDRNEVFVFNGELRGVRIKANGRIGAEKIYNYISNFSGDSQSNGIRKGIDIIKKRTRYIRAMNFFIAGSGNVRYASFFNENPGYFTLKRKRYSECTVICSQVFPDDPFGWEDIENNSTGEVR